jgi:nucleoside 2-deoxyribosyltransferase
MNIYFACSITGGRQDEHIYQKIVEALLSDGHEIPTAGIATPEIVELENLVDPKDVFERDTNWITACDVLIAEVSTPSHGVGYEIGYALSLSKPVICLHKNNRKISKMILGNQNTNLRITSYETPEEAIQTIRLYLNGIN